MYACSRQSCPAAHAMQTPQCNPNSVVPCSRRWCHDCASCRRVSLLPSLSNFVAIRMYTCARMCTGSGHVPCLHLFTRRHMHGESVLHGCLWRCITTCAQLICPPITCHLSKRGAACLISRLPCCRQPDLGWRKACWLTTGRGSLRACVHQGVCFKHQYHVCVPV